VVLENCDFDLLIDVGANSGQFALMVRSGNSSVPIVSFEPIASEAKKFQDVFRGDSMTELRVFALGEKTETRTIHISRRADSSSLLPIGDLQIEIFPSTEEVGTEEVSVVTLNDLEEIWGGSSRAFLKIDVQGFELSVLRGGNRALKNCAFVYVECSEVALYDGQALSGEVSEYLRDAGFHLVQRCNETVVNGGLVQADYLYSRADNGGEKLARGS